MSGTLTAYHRRILANETREWRRRDSDWRAGKAWLDLEDQGYLEWRPYRAGDVACGPGSHGGGWLTRLTEKGAAELIKPLGEET